MKYKTESYTGNCNLGESSRSLGLYTLCKLYEDCCIVAGFGQLLLLMMLGHGDPKAYEVAIGGGGHPQKAPLLRTSQIAACLRGFKYIQEESRSHSKCGGEKDSRD